MFKNSNNNAVPVSTPLLCFRFRQHSGIHEHSPLMAPCFVYTMVEGEAKEIYGVFHDYRGSEIAAELCELCNAVRSTASKLQPLFCKSSGLFRVDSWPKFEHGATDRR